MATMETDGPQQKVNEEAPQAMEQSDPTEGGVDAINSINLDGKVAQNIAAPPEIRLKRFLHYGNEEAIYSRVSKPLKADQLTSIDALIERGKAIDPVNHIVKAHMDGYVVHRQALIFALAYCAKQKMSLPLREAAYSAVKKICVSAEDLICFIKFSCEIGGKLHTGSGWKKAIREWYLSKTPHELADIVSRRRGYFKYTHKDIFKLAHIKTDDVAKRAIITYVMHSPKIAASQFGQEKEAQSVLSYLQAVEDFRHCENKAQGVRLVEAFNLTLEHIGTHGEMCKTREVWEAILPTLSTGKLLDCLQPLSIRGFFKGNNSLVRRYCDALNNPHAVTESGIQPARVFIELRTYELCAKEKVALAVKLNPEWANKKNPAAPKPNTMVIEAIHKLFNSSFKLLVPTGLRYLIAMDGREKMWSNRCWHSPYVYLGEAGVLTALNLIKTEREVIFGSFNGQSCFVPIPVIKEASINEVISKVKERAVVPPVVKNVFAWAEQNRKMIDVFIVLGDNTLGVDNVSSELMRYRRTMQLPNAKIITCSLNGPIKKSREVQGNGRLGVFGFDEHTPRVIEAFSRGAF